MSARKSNSTAKAAKGAKDPWEIEMAAKVSKLAAAKLTRVGMEIFVLRGGHDPLFTKLGSLPAKHRDGTYWVGVEGGLDEYDCRIVIPGEVVRRVTFEDQGQDFTWWGLNIDNVVVDCGPFQATHWFGARIMGKSAVVGLRPSIVTMSGMEMQLRYAVESIEESEVAA